MKEYLVNFTDKTGYKCCVRIFAYHAGDAMKRVKEQYSVSGWQGTKEIR